VLYGWWDKTAGGELLANGNGHNGHGSGHAGNGFKPNGVGDGVPGGVVEGESA
jgi:hypothetical protein